MNTLPKRFLPIYFSRLLIITMSSSSGSSSDGGASRADTVDQLIQTLISNILMLHYPNHN